jgi:hypothetical protein
MAARFGDDLDAALDEPLTLPIVFESFERPIAENVPYAPDRFDNIRQSRKERPGCH